MDNKPVSVRYADELDAHNVTKAALAAAQSTIAAHVASEEEKDEEIKRLQQENEELKKKLQDYEDGDKEKDAKHASEVDQLTAWLSEANAKLALSPAHRDLSAGVEPLPASAGGEDAPSTWASALALCANEPEPYVAARRKYPKLYEAFMSRNGTK